MSGLEIVWEARDVLLKGTINTLSLVSVSLLLSIPLGILGALVLIEAPLPVRRVFKEFIDFLRCIPFLLLAYLIYYALPRFGMRFDAWEAGLASLTIYNMAYLVEIFRSAYNSINKDDIEAAEAFGFSRSLKYRRIVLPQIAITAAPLIGNQIITAIRDSALLMIITVEELTFAANFINANYFSPFAPFIMAVIIYVVITLLVEWCVRRMAIIRKLRYG